MKTQLLLAILPLFSTALATPSVSWDSICGSIPQEAETTIDGQKFKYVCQSQHIGAVTIEPGVFDHPDDCARLIVNEPGTVVSWTSKGRCYKAAGPGTKGNNNLKILAMEKVDDDDVIVDDDELETCKDDLKKAQDELKETQDELKEAQDDLKVCKNASTSGGTGGGTTPTCGGTHNQGTNDWKVTCDEIHAGTMLRPVYTTADLKECIDKCIAAQSKGCRLAARLAQPTNNCVLYSGSVIKKNPKPGAMTAEIQ